MQKIKTSRWSAFPCRCLFLLAALSFFFSGCAFVIRTPAFKAAWSKTLYLRGAYHVHSQFSHDSKASLERIISTGRKAGLDFVILTDHNTMEGKNHYTGPASAGDPLLIFGVEISTDSGHLVALDVPEPPKNLYEAAGAIRWVKKMGGYSIAAHPDSLQKPWTYGHFTNIDGIEILSFPNVYYTKSMPELVTKAALLPPKQFTNAVLETPTKMLKRWDELLAHKRISMFGSVDAHLHWEWMGFAPENFLLYMQAVTMYVQTTERNTKAITNALKAGRSFMAIESRGVAQDFEFSAASNGRVYEMGDEVSLSKDLVFSVKTPAEGEIHFIENGKVVRRAQGTRLTFHAAHDGFCRVEVYRGNRLWIVSNPIYVKGKD